MKSHQGKGRFALQTLERRRTWNIGVSLQASSHFEHPVTVRKLAGLQQVLLETPYRLKILIEYDERKETVPWTPGLLDSLSPGHIDMDSLDSIIISKAGHGGDALRKIAGVIPVCCVDWFEEGRRLSRVLPDFSGGVAMAISHLIALGHHRIAALGRPDLFAAFTEGARRGERSASPSTPLRLEIEETGHYARSEGAAAARRILSRPRAEWPTALIGSDETIVGCLDVIRSMGLTVPGGISLVTINDLRADRVHEVPLSGIHIDYRLLGRLQAKELLRLLDDPEALGRDIPLPVEWVQRESTGPISRNRS